jgi:hypothetical protein
MKPVGYLLAPEQVEKLRGISKLLNDPCTRIDWDKRRDIANLIDCVILQHIIDVYPDDVNPLPNQETRTND